MNKSVYYFQLAQVVCLIKAYSCKLFLGRDRFFPTHKPTLKKPKEPFFANDRQDCE